MEITKVLGESSSSSEYSLKNILSMQPKFQPVVSSQLLQLPMHQGNIELDKITPIHKLQLGDMFHASTRKEIIETH